MAPPPSSLAFSLAPSIASSASTGCSPGATCELSTPVLAEASEWRRVRRVRARWSAGTPPVGMAEGRRLRKPAGEAEVDDMEGRPRLEASSFSFAFACDARICDCSASAWSARLWIAAGRAGVERARVEREGESRVEREEAAAGSVLAPEQCVREAEVACVRERDSLFRYRESYPTPRVLA